MYRAGEPARRREREPRGRIKGIFASAFIVASALVNLMSGGFVSLLGLSHAAYLAYKAAPKPA